MAGRRKSIHWIWTLVVAFGVGCSENSSSRGSVGPAPTTSTQSPASPSAHAANEAGASGAQDARSEAELVAAGRGIYNANCIACHNLDPKSEGALGPPVAGASYELLESRVLRAEYPNGYTPKRSTRVMIPLKHLGPNLRELAAYLNSFG